MHARSVLPPHSSRLFRYKRAHRAACGCFETPETDLLSTPVSQAISGSASPFCSPPAFLCSFDAPLQKRLSCFRSLIHETARDCMKSVILTVFRSTIYVLQTPAAVPSPRCSKVCACMEQLSVLSTLRRQLVCRSSSKSTTPFDFNLPTSPSLDLLLLSTRASPRTKSGL